MYLRVCQGLLFDAIVEGPNYEFAAETREELFYNKEKLIKRRDILEIVITCLLIKPYR